MDKKGSEKEQAKKAQRSEGKSGKENEPPLLGYRSMPLVELACSPAD